MKKQLSQDYKIQDHHIKITVILAYIAVIVHVLAMNIWKRELKIQYHLHGLKDSAY